jgi:tRNA dimethylallyltransferase
MTLQQRPVLAIIGPTASGKSALAEGLARKLDGEIVSVDSAQVYRGMNIGTAKPDAKTRAEVTYHLIDIVDPPNAYSAADWATAAEAAVNEIRSRGKVAILCGGTMLYLKALLWGFDPMPAADADFRERLRARAAANGWPVLHAELAHVDPATAARLAPNDGHRIERALEVYALTGMPISAIQADASDSRPYRVPWPVLQYGLMPTQRAWLHARIEVRFRDMVTAGLLDEVRRLRVQFPELHRELPSMRSVGYRQAWEALDGAYAKPDEWIERGVFATRQFAKRQLTWLRTWRDLKVIPAEASGLVERVSQECMG